MDDQTQSFLRMSTLSECQKLYKSDACPNEFLQYNPQGNVLDRVPGKSSNDILSNETSSSTLETSTNPTFNLENSSETLIGLNGPPPQHNNDLATNPTPPTYGKKRKNSLMDENPTLKKGVVPNNEDKKNLHLRKNIRDVMNEKNLDTTTIAAQREESERLARVAGQQKSLREIQKQVVNKQFFRILQLDDTEPLESDSLPNHLNDTPIGIPEEDSTSVTCDETNSSFSCGIDSELNKEAISGGPASEVVTIEDSSDDDCILLSEEEEEEDNNEPEDATNSGMHVKDAYNIPDEYGRVVVNIAHPEGEETLYLAPQIAKVIKPHQIGGVRFLYDNIIESLRRFKKSSGFGCILAHSMGLGKTLQVVSFCDIFLRHTPAKTVLCVMPINTLQNWLSEFNMWIPRQSDDKNVRTRNFDIYVLNDQQKTLTARSKVILSWAQNGGVLLIGYELFRLLALKLVTTRKRKGKSIYGSDGMDSHRDLMNVVCDALVKPGPDLVICDEGHRIKNSHAGISLALKQIRTRRRIVLTGYPLQNNLLEYWCMVDFVRPNYLGTRTEFCNMFERPIQNGQCVDSTPDDIKLMRYRAHVLHSLLLGFVQRRSHIVLQSTLPEKLEYVILVRMTPFQRKLYDTFMTDVVRKKAFPNPLKAFAVCCKIWNHPDVLYNFLKKCETDLDLEIDEDPPKTSSISAVDTNLPLNNPTISPKIETNNAACAAPINPPKLDNPPTTEENGELLNVCPSSDLSETSNKRTSANLYVEKEDQLNHLNTFNSYAKGNYWLDATIPSKPSCVEVLIKQTDSNIAKDFENLTGSSEIVDLDTNEIKTVETTIQSNPTLQQKYVDVSKNQFLDGNSPTTKGSSGIGSEINRQVLKTRRNDEFSCSWAVDLMKDYIPGQISNSPKMEICFCILKESIYMGDRILLFSQSLLTLNLIEGFLKTSYVPGTNSFWTRNISYFRLDGSTSSQERERLVNEFNANTNIKLFLISTRAGSLGINLTGANRVIIFDASWNPCHDTQAVYRIYRYGQRKQCYVYRIVMDKCLEKKIYDRQIKKQGMSDRIVDECNPEAHLSIKDITNLCHDYDSDDETVVEKSKETAIIPEKQNITLNTSSPMNADEVEEDSKPSAKNHSDVIINTIIARHKEFITKDPFFHESLLVDRKDRKLSQAEKRQAHRSYEMEKKASVNQKLAYTPGKMHYKVVNNDGTVITRPVASIRPMPTKKTNNAASGGRSTRWIPAEVWQRQGMTAQEMTLPLDVVIPTNSSEKANIILKAGQRVMVLKSSKGIYMQLDSGKIIAIRTTTKPTDCDKNSKGDVIDITSDCDNDTPKQKSSELDNSKDKCNGEKRDSKTNEEVNQVIAPTPAFTETRTQEHHNEMEHQQSLNQPQTSECRPQPQHQMQRELDYSQSQQPYKHQSQMSSASEGFNNSINVQSSVPITQPGVSEQKVSENTYFHRDIQHTFPPQYYDYYDNKNKPTTTNYHLNEYAPYSPFNYAPYHSNIHSSAAYGSGSSAYVNSHPFPRPHWTPVVNSPPTNESFRQHSYLGNSYQINEWSPP
ncbi:helicase ARIP4 [Scaptodrosophila lebanonensis]|uniref:Helicase ARIP4 n=1 Tax=Drosophila lebanonensis TaxID=7225 RepID=A0A6J2UFL1_DROLE|nr:helicase ARIP4 [Scaptodrosophila lebanonensis]